MLLVDAGFDSIRVYDCDNDEVLTLKKYSIKEVVDSIEKLFGLNGVNGVMKEYSIYIGKTGMDYSIGMELVKSGLPVKWMTHKVIF